MKGGRLRNENLRPTDLLRWGIAEEALNADRSGIVVKNPDGNDTVVAGFGYEVAGKWKKYGMGWLFTVMKHWMMGLRH